MDKQNNQEGAINRLSESLDELIKAVTALNDAVAQLAGANPEVK